MEQEPLYVDIAVRRGRPSQAKRQREAEADAERGPLRRLRSPNDHPAALPGVRDGEPHATRLRPHVDAHPARVPGDPPQLREMRGPAKQVDHVTPLSQGGTHLWTNLQSLCLRCHAVKSKRERREGLLASQG